jgi:hypothetical protein
MKNGATNEGIIDDKAMNSRKLLGYEDKVKKILTEIRR